MTDATAEPTTAEPTVAPPANLAELAALLTDDVARLDGELVEVDLLITQAKTESARHEGRRAAVSDKIAALGRDGGDQAELLDLTTQLVNLTKRAALMDSQVDVLEGKRRTLVRNRDTVAGYAETVAGMDPLLALANAAVAPAKASGKKGGVEVEAMPPAVSRLVLSGQEDLRREIARAMHDGPAQSLTNIVLQAQIVERLVEKDPTAAQPEVQQLVAMVQQTLDATKTFIFDVRPMVLDDLGLVPTLRRATRERGQRAGLTVDFDSNGQDRRLPMDLESGLFRMLDEAMVAYLDRSPDHLTLRLDWTPERVEAHMSATRDAKASDIQPEEVPPDGKDLPPALAAMMEERRVAARDRAEATRKGLIVSMPPTTWREIQGRASSIGATVELLDEGAGLYLVVDAPADAEG